ncbi:MAG: hypothetical protein WBE34_01110 [Candidatus Nitrosopolaris sp.]
MVGSSSDSVLLETEEIEAGHEERDIELENIVGNLMIAEYQVDKLRSRVSEKVGGKYIYESEAGKKVSTHMFKHENRWVKISLKVEEMPIDKSQAVQEME